jgi:DnaJ-class molecular chaperone
MQNFYGLLGVPKDTSLNTIKRAYRSLARQHHTDHGRLGAILLIFMRQLLH